MVSIRIRQGLNWESGGMWTYRLEADLSGEIRESALKFLSLLVLPRAGNTGHADVSPTNVGRVERREGVDAFR
jgi:hypothetical protein